jgi:hypothetical protein
MVVERSPTVPQTAQPEKSTQDRKGKAPATDDDGEGWDNFREDPILTVTARLGHALATNPLCGWKPMGHALGRKP